MGKKQISKNDINNFYTHAASQVKRIENERRKFGRANSPWFNPIEFWWIDEKKVAEILAFLLNPSESHEQGDRYLRHFIKKFGLDFFVYNRRDKIYVQCGVPTHENEKMDVVIYKNSFEQAIAIVNGAGVNTNRQKEVLMHYSEYLWNRTGNDYCVIYLSAYSGDISERSISREERRELMRSRQFKHLIYEEHLIDCVAEFADITESVRVKSFLKDVEKSMRKKFMGEKDLEAKKAMVDMINNSQKNLEISFMVSNSLPEVKRKLRERFNAQMESLRKELKLDAKQESDRVWLKPKKWKYHYFSYGYRDGHVFYGMTQDERETGKQKFNGVINHLNENLKGGFRYSEWWPAYKYLYRDIDSNPDFWKAIRNGKAKREIKRFIELMIEEYEVDDF